MATGTVVPISEYLHTLYRPDCDYVDGQLQERLYGLWDHSAVRGELLHLLMTDESKRHCEALLSLRVKISETRYRVADVCVLSKTAPREQIIVTPPLLCMEVLEPMDIMERIEEKVRDFLGIGVPEVWLIDPATRVVRVCTTAREVLWSSGKLTVPHTAVVLDIAHIFIVLDEF